MEKEAKQIIDLKRNLFKIDVRAQKDEEKVFMRTACTLFSMAGKTSAFVVK
nr:exfoliative toxin [Streptococcus agalactiae]